MVIPLAKVRDEEIRFQGEEISALAFELMALSYMGVLSDTVPLISDIVSSQLRTQWEQCVRGTIVPLSSKHAY